MSELAEQGAPLLTGQPRSVLDAPRGLPVRTRAIAPDRIGGAARVRPYGSARTARADHVAEQWDDSNWALLRGCPVAKTPTKKATKGT